MVEVIDCGVSTADVLVESSTMGVRLASEVNLTVLLGVILIIESMTLVGGVVWESSVVENIAVGLGVTTDPMD